MKILLVNPTKLDIYGKPIKFKTAWFPPLNIAMLNSLTPVQHNVTVINDVVEDVDFSSSYNLVGITSMTAQIERAYQISDKFRASGTKVVIGGFHATLLSKEVKEHADSVVIGEVDNIWEQILSDCENGNLKEFYQDTSAPDLQKLLIPKWDNINLDIYAKQFNDKYPIMMPLFTTRGCVFDCKFCSVSKFYGKTYRVKPVANVIKEIDSLDFKNYFFVDDNIACNPNYSRELFKALSGKNISWYSQISTTVLKTPDLIDLAAKGGCHRLFIGIESINKNNLQSMDKSFNKIEEYEELFARVRKAGIVPEASIIFGLDNDTPEVFGETIDFLMKNKVETAIFWILIPLPGTEVFNEMNDGGRLITKDWSLYDGTNVVFQPINFTKDDLYTNYWDTYQKYFSLKNIMKRIFYTVPISPNPVGQFLETFFLQYNFRKKVNSYLHPMFGGVNRIIN